MAETPSTRTSEWFVPSFGPVRFRSFFGLLFLPYTGMVLSFLAIGSCLPTPIHWDRLIAIEIIYFLALGIGAHALDALGSKGMKPWGAVFSRRQLWIVAVGSLVGAYAIAGYYMARYVPFLLPLAVLEGFFVFAYNMEWHKGTFHSDRWFAFSWGFLPVIAGYVMQTNGLAIPAVVLAGAAGLLSLVEIKASRPYKDLKRRSDELTEEQAVMMQRLETILKSVSIGTILLGAGLLARHIFH